MDIFWLDRNPIRKYDILKQDWRNVNMMQYNHVGFRGYNSLDARVKAMDNSVNSSLQNGWTVVSENVMALKNPVSLETNYSAVILFGK